jgi:hypothetical protein
MTRSTKKSKKSSSRKILLAAPVIAVVIVGLTLYGAYSTPKGAVINFHSYFEIGLVNNAGTVRYVLPNQQIGVPGGFMSTTKYLGDGLNGNYPLYSSPYQCANSTVSTICAISVYSKVTRQYTLGDFFDVWGVPLSPSVTLTTAYSSNSTYSWTMCTSSLSSASSSNNAWAPSSDWGNHVLAQNEVVFLAFSNLNLPCNS